MLIEKIPGKWREWIFENVTRGGDHRQILAVLIEHGVIGPDQARDFLAEIPALLHPPTGPARPHIDPGRAERSLDGQIVRLVASASQPVLRLVENLASVEECQELIRSGADRLREIEVLTKVSRFPVRHPDRTGSFSIFRKGQTALIERLENRIAQLTGWPAERCEGLQLIRYQIGEQYKPHFDGFDRDTESGADEINRRGQRIATLILYLNQPEEGGETCFPAIGGLRLQPKTGSAVYFENCDDMGGIDPSALHCGMPVLAGEKWIATKWFRERIPS